MVADRRGDCSMKDDGMATGTVKWYDGDKGFGFIARDDGGADLFVHHSVLGNEVLAEGDRVSFSVGFGPKGERAEAIQVLERSGMPPRQSRFSGGYQSNPRYGGGAARYGNDLQGGTRERSFSSRPPVDPSLLPRGTGVIRTFDASRGFGFIIQDGGGPDLFFHQSVVTGMPPLSGAHVEYRIGESPKGPRAELVTRLNER
jgi:CspA family cold shock protein